MDVQPGLAGRWNWVISLNTTDEPDKRNENINVSNLFNAKIEWLVTKKNRLGENVTFRTSVKF